MGSKKVLMKTTYGNVLARRKGESLKSLALRQDEEYAEKSCLVSGMKCHMKGSITET